ncbi:hypothetical protein [Chryseobacterium sp. CFS15]|uniref:hypothetical protein n=1 Tax=Chryseobacterium sp. CFS15 TaxID=2986946 RepID=UPI0028086E26|nr:hypothetical protein [Chryseobacterium sp. CFS15]MDQ8140730.1 hypothetical protein [Chryseobacterium sp. CFS15]
MSIIIKNYALKRNSENLQGLWISPDRKNSLKSLNKIKTSKAEIEMEGTLKKANPSTNDC